MGKTIHFIPDLSLAVHAWDPQHFKLGSHFREYHGTTPNLSPIQGEGRLLHPSHRAWCWLRFINPGVVLAIPGCTIPLGFLLHRRLGDFMPPTCPGRTCTPPGSTTNALSPSPCTGTSSSSFLLHCLLRDATVSIVIWIYNFAYLFTFWFFFC